MRRVAALGISAALAFGLAACGGTDPNVAACQHWIDRMSSFNAAPEPSALLAWQSASAQDALLATGDVAAALSVAAPMMRPGVNASLVGFAMQRVGDACLRADGVH